MVTKIIQNGASLPHLNRVQPLHHDRAIHKKIFEPLAPLVPVSTFVKEVLVAQMGNILDENNIHILITGEEAVDKRRLMKAVSNMVPRSCRHPNKYRPEEFIYAHDGLLTVYQERTGEYRNLWSVLE